VSETGLLVKATSRVLRDAEELGFPGVVESAVESAILTRTTPRGFCQLRADARLVEIDGWRVRLRTHGRTPQGRRILLATRIERAPVEATHGRR
jgi:hypothetical protein